MRIGTYIYVMANLECEVNLLLLFEVIEKNELKFWNVSFSLERKGFVIYIGDLI